MPAMSVCARFRIGLHFERRIVFGQALKHKAQTLLVGAGLRLDGHRHDRRREDWAAPAAQAHPRAQGVARGDFLQPGDDCNVAGKGRLDRGLLVSMDFRNPADPLAAPVTALSTEIARPKYAGIDPHEDAAARILVRAEFEDQSTERFGITDRNGRGFARLGISTGSRRQIDRARQIVDHRIEQRLHADDT